MSHDKTPEQILEEAGELIHRGWVKGHLSRVENGEHSYCIVGAIQKAALGRNLGFTSAQSSHSGYSRAWGAVADVLGNHVSITQFNDFHSTTLEDVQLLLKRARERVAEEGEG